MYFIGFAMLIILLIWFLQIFFLNTYYEEMKISETTKIANNIINQYNNDTSHLADTIESITDANDIYIKIESADGALLFKPKSSQGIPIYLYSIQVQMLKTRLSKSPMDKVTITLEDTTKTKTLAYACYLDKTQGQEIILYIFSPLYPVKSTVSILRNQLIYITTIALLLALTLAIYLANRISRPIKDITNSAAKMGKGNYNIKFKGGHFSEITELADTLNTASYELEKTSMYQKDLIANVSHDLRTPLTMIRSYAELIRDISGNNPEKREAHLQVIIDEADRLNNLVSDMLSLSRMQSRKIVLEKTDFDIKHVAETLLTSYNILAEQEGYIFKFNCPKPITINGDEAKIKQVLSNLINNAVKYCGKDKTIIINIKKIRNKMRCEIIDHGAGIASDELTHVWERYYKSSTHHVRTTEGSGLGLSIVKEILTLHKANFGVNSKLGKGSTFWFEMDLPKAR